MARPDRYAFEQLFQPGAETPEPDRQRVRAALAEARATVAPADPALLQTAEAIRILAEAGRRLTRERPRWPAVLALVETAPEALRERLPLRLLWLRALTRLGRRSEVMPEITRLLNLEPVDPRRDAALVQLALQMGVALKLPPLPRLYELLWGAPGPSLIETLTGLDLGRYRGFVTPAVLGYFCQLRDIRQDQAPAFADQIAWSLAAAHFVKYVYGVETRALQRSDPPVASSRTEQSLLDFAVQLRAEIARSDLSLLKNLRDQGRSILLLGSHLGLLEPSLTDLAHLGMPLALIHSGNQLLRHQTLRNPPKAMVDIRTRDNPALPFELLKLAKRQRSEQFLTRIYPDGGHSDATRQIDLGGRRIEIGTGAAVLAYYGRAQLVFSKSRWTGQGWVADLQLGPDLAQAGSLEVAGDLLAGFYAEQLNAALLGPAADIGGHGGALPQLREQLG